MSSDVGRDGQGREIQCELGLACERVDWSTVWMRALCHAVEGLTGMHAEAFLKDYSEYSAYVAIRVTEKDTGEHGVLFFKRSLRCPLLGRDLKTSELEVIDHFPGKGAGEHLRPGTIPFRMVVAADAIPKYEM